MKKSERTGKVRLAILPYGNRHYDKYGFQLYEVTLGDCESSGMVLLDATELERSAVEELGFDLPLLQ